MSFEQATIGVVKQLEFGDLRTAIERSLAGEQVVKFLKALESRNIRVRNLDAVLAANLIDSVAGAKNGTAQALYQGLPVSDQAQMREFYLSKIEEVDPALRAKFHKVYQYS
jgi:7,8-dihydro-6-hydroxymethylpterin-pyrophosphokinase